MLWFSPQRLSGEPKRNHPILSRSCPRVSEINFRKTFLGEFPNIRGRLSYTAANDPRANSYASSALTYPIQEQHLRTSYVMDYDVVTPADIGLDASLHNSIYQDAAITVQSAALRSLSLIRAY